MNKIKFSISMKFNLKNITTLIIILESNELRIIYSAVIYMKECWRKKKKN
jgi:hypothetical protein